MCMTGICNGASHAMGLLRCAMQCAKLHYPLVVKIWMFCSSDTFIREGLKFFLTATTINGGFDAKITAQYSVHISIYYSNFLFEANTSDCRGSVGSNSFYGQ